ncbi:MAG TPA: lipid-A-disaccharide synthase [Myxococcaceae bacterium]|nr:lipid-A-disaccharide synthase [Myxococcaceae bacterium]
MGLTEIMVVAGEASGDGHAADLVAQLRAREPQLRFFGMGGPRMAAQGVDRIYGAHEISVMGFAEVLPKVRRIAAVLRGLVRAAGRRRPSCAVLVDVPDFNLRLAARLKRLGIPVVYYVSPMIWAWRPNRIHQIARVVDAMLCILPFEEAYYRERGVPARYVGSPVLEQVPAPAPAAHFRRALGLPESAPTLALLPGSRRGEVSRLLPDLVQAAALMRKETPGLQILVPVAPGLVRSEVEDSFTAAGVSATLLDGRAPEAVGASDVAVVASGTATLEAGLMGRPLVVVYRIAPTSYWIAKRLVRLPAFSLVNLLAGKPLVPELLQDEVTPGRIVKEVRALWEGPAREAVVEGLGQLRASLGSPGAAARAADEVLSVVNRRSAMPPAS